MYLQIVIVLVLLVALASGIRIVRPTHKGIIERLGKYRKTAEGGFHWIIPLIDRMHYVNITEQMMDTDPQQVITKDKLNTKIDALVFYKVEDTIKALYNADDYEKQIWNLARTALRDIIGKMDLSEANSERSQINTRLRDMLDKETKTYGVDVLRVELQSITPPEDVQHSMNEVVKAEQEKIAAVNLSIAQEIRADGEKKAAIKQAQGKSEAIKEVAKAEADAIRSIAAAKANQIEVINKAADQHFVGNAQLLKKLETFAESFKEGTKVILDTDKDMINVISDISGIVPTNMGKKRKREEGD